MSTQRWKYYYLIRCQTMPRAERVLVNDAYEMMRMVESYLVRFGPIELLIEDGRA